MSNSTIGLLSWQSTEVTIYVGSFLFILGIVGNPITLLIFLSLQTFRQSSCAFYLIIMCIANTCNLCPVLLTFIVTNGFYINWTNGSLFYCKFRAYIVQVLLLTSLSCMCLAIIDQFLATCINPRWHRFNNIKLARCIIIGLVILYSFWDIPFLLYYNHATSSTAIGPVCTITNPTFRYYNYYFYRPGITIGLPATVEITFGLLAYRNVRQGIYRTVPLVRRELDKQLTTMVLVQVIFNVIVFIPTTVAYTFSTIYNTTSDRLLLAKLDFLQNISSIIAYAHPVVNNRYFQF